MSHNATKTTLNLNLSDSDLLALEAIAGHNPELIAGIVSAMVKQRLVQFKQAGTVITFHSGDHLDNVPPVSLQAVANGNILALAFVGPAIETSSQLMPFHIQPTLFTVLGKIDDDYLVTPAGVGSRIMSGQDSIAFDHKPFFDTKALSECAPAFAAQRGQFGEGHIQMFPVTTAHGYMQFDLSTMPTYRVPGSVLYGLPTEVREEFNQCAAPQYQGQAHFGGYGGYQPPHGFRGRNSDQWGNGGGFNNGGL